MHWRVHNRALWGDYGEILIAGLFHRCESTGVLICDRCGPFVPPMFLAGVLSPTDWGSRIVATDAARESIENVHPGLAWEAVQYGRVVRRNWRWWPRTLPFPLFVPWGGEPEHYVLRGRDDPRLAARMPKLWATRFPGSTSATRREGLAIAGGAERSSAKAPHLFSIKRGSALAVDTVGRDLLAALGEGWLRFVPTRNSSC
jgi:hypothetical protein